MNPYNCMQIILSRIWTQESVSISNDDNHYIIGRFNVYKRFCIYKYINFVFASDVFSVCIPQIWLG